MFMIKQALQKIYWVKPLLLTKTNDLKGLASGVIGNSLRFGRETFKSIIRKDFSQFRYDNFKFITGRTYMEQSSRWCFNIFDYSICSYNVINIIWLIQPSIGWFLKLENRCNLAIKTKSEKEKKENDMKYFDRWDFSNN